MGQTLEHGIFLPDEGERNCYSGLAENWVALDTLVGAYSSHYQNTTIHVTASDKQTWNGKQDALSQTQLDAVNSGIDSTKVQQIATNTSDISSLQSGKANDSDVVHKSGNETIGGTKTFTDNNMIKTSSPKVLLINTSQTGNTAPSSNTSSFFRFDGGTVNNFGGVQCEFLTTGENRLTNYVKDITTVKINTIQQRASSTTAMTVFNADLIAPATDGVTALGSSSKHWSDVQTYKVNGVEPSSLSLPSSSGTIDISSYITDLTGVSVNIYTPLANGYIVITCNSTDVDYIKMSNNLDFVSVVDNTNNQFTSGILGVWQPCIAGISIQIRIKSSALKIAKFIPCQGNV